MRIVAGQFRFMHQRRAMVRPVREARGSWGRRPALLRGSKTDPQRPLPTDPLTTDSVRRRPTKLSHLIEDVTCEDGLDQHSPDLEESQRIDDEWLVTYNEQRPHRALGYLPPNAVSNELAGESGPSFRMESYLVEGPRDYAEGEWA